MLTLILLCPVLAVALTQKAAYELPSAIPLISSLCSKGCPAVCKTISSLCIDVPVVGPKCTEVKSQCDKACTQTCDCVTKCGDGCDDFEKRCLSIGIPLIPGVFCPINGGACDVACVSTCPQSTLLTLMQVVAERVGTTVQEMVGLTISTLTG